MTEFGKVDDSYKSAEYGAGQAGFRGSKQHLYLPIYERTKGRLLIEVDAVADLNISSISVPYDESIRDFIARNNPDPDTENADMPVMVKGYRTSSQTPVTSTPISMRSPPC